MEKVEYAKIKEILDGMVSVEVADAEGRGHELNGKHVLHFGEGRLDTTFSEITVEGYTSTCDGLTEQFATFEDMCSYLKDIGAADGKRMFLRKCGEFDSIAEYELKGAFDELDMEGILNFYPEADEFELVDSSPSYEKLDDGEVERLQHECREFAKTAVKSIYDGLAPNARAALPEFEQLWQEIGEEVKSFLKKVKYGKLKKGESPYICDHVGKDTRYSEPAHLFWHAYHSYGLAEEQCAQAAALKDSDGKDCTFEDGRFAPLLPHLISSRMTFTWHCTAGQLARLYRFALNDETKKWLLQYKSDYDLEGLQDLALYCGGELLYSSCTREVFRNDFRKK